MSNVRATAHSLLARSCLATFGESCIYSPKIGAPRTVVAAIDELGGMDEQRTGKMLRRHIRAFVLRDAADATYGGIDTPEVGDGLRPERVPSGAGYSWIGQVEDATEYGWALVFERVLPHQLGGNR